MPRCLRNIVRLILQLISLLVVSTAVSANCKLPILDGGDKPYVHSSADIFGDIDSIDFPYIFIKNSKTRAIDKISVSKTKEVYSVYGGVKPISALHPKMQVWVWFEDCESLTKNIPVAAYLEFFSTNVLDRAVLDDNGEIITTP